MSDVKPEPRWDDGIPFCTIYCPCSHSAARMPDRDLAVLCRNTLGKEVCRPAVRNMGHRLRAAESATATKEPE